MKGRRLNGCALGLEKFAAAVIIILSLLFITYLTGAAFLETTDISTNNAAGECADIFSDNVFLNIILTAIFLAGLYLFYRHSFEISIRKLERVLLLWTFALGMAFIASTKLRAPWYNDSYLVVYAAQRAAVGEFSAMDNYFVRFPFQFGYVMYAEIFFRVVKTVMHGLPEGYYCIALQAVNLLWLLLGYHALIRMSMFIFSSKRIQKLTALLLFLCLPPVLSCTFLYGNMPAFGCGTAALWMFLAFLNRGRLRYGLACAVFLTAAVILKLNLLIFCVAVAIVWVMELLKKFSFRSLVCFILAAVCVLTVKQMPQRLYEQRSGRDFGSGIPMIAWMAMGFNEGHAGPGWYSEDCTVKAFAANGNDPEATAEYAKKVLARRMEEFRERPGKALSFFSEKLRTQWNEPSYGSLWLNQVQPSYSEKTGIYRLLCESGEPVTKVLMNQFQQLVFFGMLLSLFELWRHRDMRNCLLPLIVLGGLLYHLLFEAKSLYAQPYFMLMIPMAAFGFGWFFYRIENR